MIICFEKLCLTQYIMNIYFIQEMLENVLSQLGYFYVPNNANKKRAKDFFASFPFFFYDMNHQNELYSIIQAKPLTSFYDNTETMKEYCHYIYSAFSLKHGLPTKKRNEFYLNLKRQLLHGTEHHKQWKQKNIQSYLFICLFILMIILFYWFEKNV